MKAVFELEHKPRFLRYYPGLINDYKIVPLKSAMTKLVDGERYVVLETEGDKDEDVKEVNNVRINNIKRENISN